MDDGAVFEELRGHAKFTTENRAFYLDKKKRLIITFWGLLNK